MVFLLVRESFSRCFSSLGFRSRMPRNRRGHCYYTCGQASGSCGNEQRGSHFPFLPTSLGTLLMAVSGSELISFSVPSYIRDYQAYQDVWFPFTGEVLPLKREPDNPEDVHAVAIKRASSIVEHVPFNLAPTVSAFLRRSRNNVWQKWEVLRWIVVVATA